MQALRSTLMAVAVSGLLLTACGGAPGGSTTGGVREFRTTATDFKYDPANQTFKTGEKLKLTMINRGAVDHTWVLQDAAGAEVVKLEVKVGQTGSKEFTAPAAGSYNIVCDIAGHKEAGMTAKATIQ